MRVDDLLETAHVLICNVSGGNLDLQSPEWVRAARSFIAEYGKWASGDWCEHGVKDGDWCEPCNKEMKTAIAENCAHERLHCWADGPDMDDMSTTCMLESGHSSPHEWTRDDEISIIFNDGPPAGDGAVNSVPPTGNVAG